jgi:hypothetical protein
MKFKDCLLRYKGVTRQSLVTLIKIWKIHGVKISF